jgi:uncharacterized membrane protein
MKFENSVIINQPVQQVFEYVTDFNNNVAWQTDILEMEITSEGAFGRGATYRCVNRFMGKRLETKGRVTEFEMVTGTSSLDFETVEGGTRFTASGDLDLAYFKLARLLVKRKIHQQLKGDMRNLKAILENGNIP